MMQWRNGWLSAGLFLVFLFLPVREAGAVSFTVGQLQHHCQSYLKLLGRKSKARLTKAQAVDIVKCNSFIVGFHFGKTVANEENGTVGPYCLPRLRNTSDWLVRNFVRWAGRNPRYKRKTAAFGLYKSLQEKYACSDGDNRKK